MKRMLFFLFFSLPVYLIAQDYYLEAITNTKNGNKNSTSFQKIWLSPNKIKFSQNDLQLIIRTDLEKIYYINDLKKTYFTINQKELFIIDMLSFYIMPSLDLQIVNIQELPEIKKRINDWNCFKTRLLIKTNTEDENISIINVWSTKEFNLGYSLLDELVEIIKNPFSIIKEAADRIKGFPILIEGNIFYHNENYIVRSEVKKISKNPKQKEGIFDIPKGYKEEKINIIRSRTNLQ